jgi:hypothetical protein
VPLPLDPRFRGGDGWDASIKSDDALVSAIRFIRCKQTTCDLGKLGAGDHIDGQASSEAAMSDSPGTGDLWDNPMGTDGFEFVEYTGPDPTQLGALFERMGFVAAARHRSKNVTLYKQGDVNFIVKLLRSSLSPPPLWRILIN